MTVLARSFAFEGLNFDEHHMGLDGFIDEETTEVKKAIGSIARVALVTVTITSVGAACVSVQRVGAADATIVKLDESVAAPVANATATGSVTTAPSSRSSSPSVDGRPWCTRNVLPAGLARPTR